MRGRETQLRRRWLKEPGLPTGALPLPPTRLHPMRRSQAGAVRFMAPQTNWSSVLLDPRSNFTVFVPSEAGFQANADGRG